MEKREGTDGHGGTHSTTPLERPGEKGGAVGDVRVSLYE